MLDFANIASKKSGKQPSRVYDWIPVDCEYPTISGIDGTLHFDLDLTKQSFVFWVEVKFSWVLSISKLGLIRHIDDDDDDSLFRQAFDNVSQQDLLGHLTLCPNTTQISAPYQFRLDSNIKHNIEPYLIRNVSFGIESTVIYKT